MWLEIYSIAVAALRSFGYLAQKTKLSIGKNEKVHAPLVQTRRKRWEASASQLLEGRYSEYQSCTKYVRFERRGCWKHWTAGQGQQKLQKGGYVFDCQTNNIFARNKVQIRWCWRLLVVFKTGAEALWRGHDFIESDCLLSEWYSGKRQNKSATANSKVWSFMVITLTIHEKDIYEKFAKLFVAPTPNYCLPRSCVFYSVGLNWITSDFSRPTLPYVRRSEDKSKLQIHSFTKKGLILWFGAKGITGNNFGELLSIKL